MVQNPPDGMQRIIPYLIYDDAGKAIDFLCKAFGFEEAFRFPMEDGAVGHAELRQGGNVLMLASKYEPMGFAGPGSLAANHGQVMCYVDDVDAHYQRARAAGATIAGEPKDEPYGDRVYRAVDLEGHKWVFATHVRDVDPAELMNQDQNQG